MLRDIGTIHLLEKGDRFIYFFRILPAMKLKLQVASLVTLGLLSGFVLAIILAAGYVADILSAYFVIGAIIAFNLIMWLLGPYISDFMYKWLYKMEFYTYDQIKDYPYAKFTKEVCDRHKMKFPKIGIIHDKNPTAFTYGSAAFNARVVLTEGLFEFLNEDELESVIAHELGHIANRDFIIMTIAATLLQILYELYVILTRSRAQSTTESLGMGKSDNKEGGNPLVIIGVVSLVFYFIGTYLLMFLSRLREYYADEFSAKETGNPNILSSALIKIAYGIATVPDSAKTAHLLNNTRAQGIFDFKTAKETGLVYQNSKKKKGLIEKALLFDIVNPWAWVLQLKSTHPLIGKRIARLCGMTDKPAFDFRKILNEDIDHRRLWRNFLMDIFVSNSRMIVLLGTVAVLIWQSMVGLGVALPVMAAGVALYIYASVMVIRYRYPLAEFEKSNVLECMADVYASPVRGTPVSLEGQAIGRGEAGFVFGEDMMFQDKEGLIYLNYESSVPFFGNLLFAWKKLESLLGKPASVKGWFMRGATHHIELYRFTQGQETIKSYVRFWAIAGSILLIVILSLVVLLWFGGAFFG